MIWSWLRQKLSFVRPEREKYVRASRSVNGWTVEPGIEWRAGDDFEFMTGMLQDVCERTHQIGAYSANGISETVAELIETVWPDRAYFVEVHNDDGWIQVFQPFGIPRNV